MATYPTFMEGDGGNAIGAAFEDADGAAHTPTTIHYRIDCLTTGTEVRDDTAIGAASSVNITLTQTDTAVQDSDNDIELKRLRIILDTGTDSQRTEDFLFQVRNSSEP